MPSLALLLLLLVSSLATISHCKVSTSDQDAKKRLQFGMLPRYGPDLRDETYKACYEKIGAPNASEYQFCIEDARSSWSFDSNAQQVQDKSMKDRCCCYWDIVDCWNDAAAEKCTREESQALDKLWDARSDAGFNIPSENGCDPKSKASVMCTEYTRDSISCLWNGWGWFVIVGAVVLMVGAAIACYVGYQLAEPERRKRFLKGWRFMP